MRFGDASPVVAISFGNIPVEAMRMLAELDAVRASGATLAVIEPHSEFLVLIKYGAAMMDSNLVPEAYRLGQITAVGEAESVRHVWNSH